MKNKLIATLFFVLITFGAAANGDYAIIFGKYKHEKAKKITLYSVKDGRLSEYASTLLGENGTFAFSLVPDSYGFYYLGDESEYFRVYLKSGETVNVDIDATANMMSLKGKNSPENELLIRWQNIISQVEFMAVSQKGIMNTYSDFYPELNKTIPLYLEFIKKLNTKDAHFNNEMRYIADSDIRYFALAFLASGRTKHPERSNITDFHRQVLTENICQKKILTLPYCWNYINSYFSVSRNYGDKSSEIPFMDMVLAGMNDNELKSKYVMTQLSKNAKPGQYEEFMKKYGSYFITAEQKNAATSIGAPLMNISSGQKAIGFVYPDIDGKQHSLSDYLGKVVVIDVWATWCSPCRNEIPSLQKLEHAYAGKDVAFISISVDEIKPKWENFVKEQKLTGIQLHGDEKIRENYKITGIPRFIVIDKKGNIVAADAPRPSNGMLRVMIEEELKK